MKSLEIISVRMSLPDPRLKEDLQAICREVRLSSAVELDVYTNGDFPGDLAIILLWPSASSMEEGTDLGNNLSAVLKRFGLVDHSVWVKAERGQDNRQGRPLVAQAEIQN
jgi:hypothetical protein